MTKVAGAAVSVGVTAYFAYEAYAWINEFADFLTTKPRMGQIPYWLFKNPPTFLLEMYLWYFTPNIVSTLMSTNKLLALADYSDPTFRCGDDIICTLMKRFLAMF